MFKRGKKPYFVRRGEEVRPKKEDAWLKSKSAQKLVPVVSTVLFREELARLFEVQQIVRVVGCRTRAIALKASCAECLAAPVRP